MSQFDLSNNLHLARKALERANVPMSYVGMSPEYCVHDFPLDCCECKVPSIPTPKVCGIKQKQKDNDMYAKAHAEVNNLAATPLEIQQKDYLLKRLDQAEKTRKNDLRTQFEIDEPTGPRTVKDAKAALMAGNFTFMGGNTKDDEPFASFYNLREFISWRTKPADKAGYEAAKADLVTAKQSVTDEIWSLDYAKGLAALEAFETPTLN